jgi:hypothetical protein
MCFFWWPFLTKKGIHMQMTQLHGTYFVPYFPKLVEKTGSKNSGIIFGRLEYWFQKMGKSFYKFLEPCKKHPLYKTGDSWEEEIGLDRRAFNRAFDRIGHRFKSKSEFLKAEDPFEGKLYASYYDRKTNRMYYIRNAVEIKKLYQFLENQSSTTGRSCNDHNGRSFTRARIIKSNKQITTPSLQKDSIENRSDKARSEHEGEGKEMFNLWKRYVGESSENLSSHGENNAQKSLVKNFNGSLEKWEEHCLAISSSSFLMGEANNTHFQKALFSWAITDEAIEKIRSGQFRLGDRVKNIGAKLEEAESRELSQRESSYSTAYQQSRQKFYQSTKHLEKAPQEEREQIPEFQAYKQYLEAKNKTDSNPSFIKAQLLFLQREAIQFSTDFLLGMTQDSRLFRSDFYGFLIDFYDLRKEMLPQKAPENRDIDELKTLYEKLEKFDKESFLAKNVQKNENSEFEQEKGRGGSRIPSCEIIASVQMSEGFCEEMLEEDESDMRDDCTMEDISRAAGEMWNSMTAQEQAKLKESYKNYVIENEPLIAPLMEMEGIDSPVIQPFLEHYVVKTGVFEHGKR